MNQTNNLKFDLLSFFFFAQTNQTYQEMKNTNHTLNTVKQMLECSPLVKRIASAWNVANLLSTKSAPNIHKVKYLLARDPKLFVDKFHYDS